MARAGVSNHGGEPRFVSLRGRGCVQGCWDVWLAPSRIVYGSFIVGARRNARNELDRHGSEWITAYSYARPCTGNRPGFKRDRLRGGRAIVAWTVRGRGWVIRPRSARGGMGQRLFYIHQAIVEVLEAFPPSSVALERIHSHVRYPRTAILMAHARGALMLAAAQHHTPVFGYAATMIKKTLTGNGRAPKAQIQHAIMTELRLEGLPEPHDVADACAVALCHFHVSRNQRGLEES